MVRLGDPPSQMSPPAAPINRDEIIRKRRVVGASKRPTASRPKRLTDEDGTVFEARVSIVSASVAEIGSFSTRACS